MELKVIEIININNNNDDGDYDDDDDDDDDNNNNNNNNNNNVNLCKLFEAIQHKLHGYYGHARRHLWLNQLPEVVVRRPEEQGRRQTCRRIRSGSECGDRVVFVRWFSNNLIKLELIINYLFNNDES